MTNTFLTAALVCVCFTGILSAAPATQPDFATTPLRVQTLRGSDHFIYGETRCSPADLRTAVADLIKPLGAARDSGKLQLAGSLTVIVRGQMADPNGTVTLRVGYPLKADAEAPPEHCQMGKLEPMRAATTVLSGSLVDITSAYQSLFEELFTAGLQPVEETRQVYAYWEGPDSANNVIILQVGVKE